MQDASQWAALLHRAFRQKEGDAVCQLLSPGVKVQNKNLGT